MGQGQSKREEPLETIQGLQIARVLPRSPAHAAGLVPFFDIITAVDDIAILDPATASEQFRLYISGREHQPLRLRVYNLRLRAHREVRCVPSRAWGGGGLLGCSIEWAAAAGCVARSWHVVAVLAGGPAGRGGLAAGRDHVIGMQRPEEPLVTLLRDEEDLHSRLGLWRGLQRAALQRRQRRQLYGSSSSSASAASTSLEGGGGLGVEEEGDVWLGRLVVLVYDAVANEVREAVLEFGDEVDAPLGMNLASGLLHSLVATDDDTTGLIEEVENDATQEEEEEEEEKRKNQNSGGKDDNNSIGSNNNNSSSTSKVKNRSGASRGLPVMTTFLTPSGTLEVLERYTREMPVPLVKEEQQEIETHTTREDVAQPALLPSIPAPYTTPIPTVQQSFPPPPLPQLQTKEIQPQYLANVTESESSINTKVSNGIQGIRMPPPIPFNDRSTIPIISRSRPTTTSGFVEIHHPQQQQQQQQQQSKVQEYQQPQQPQQQPQPSSLQQQQHLNPFRESNVVVTNGPSPALCHQEQPQPQPQPQKQQQEQNLAVDVNVDKKGDNSSIAQNISRDINSGFKPTAQQPPMGFPKLPPPLHFPIIRPRSPTQ